MKFASLFAPRHIPALALVYAFSMAGLSAAPTPDPGFITAKTWTDPALPAHPHAMGDSRSDDTQNLQDMINYAVAHNVAVQLEPGQYKTTKTLVIQKPSSSFNLGFRISGIAGPNCDGATVYQGVSIVLTTTDTTQPAVLEVGEGGFYDMAFESIGLTSTCPNCGTKYGLLFAGQNYSHAKIDMVTVGNVDTAYAITPIPGVTPGGNGEGVNIDNCRTYNVNCFYYNNSPSGQALCHSISRCEWGVNNGGSAIRFGANSPGLGLDVTSFSGTFGDGPLRNTLIECDGPPTTVNLTGGRIEQCNTLIAYSGGSNQVIGHIVIRGMDFDAVNVCHTKTTPAAWITKPFPLIDDTLNGKLSQTPMQYSNVIDDCRFNGNYGAPFPKVALVGIPGDNSRTYFDRCTFTGFSNFLTDPGDAKLQAALKNLSAKVRDCRYNLGQTGSVPFTDISYP